MGSDLAVSLELWVENGLRFEESRDRRGGKYKCMAPTLFPIPIKRAGISS